MLSTLIQPEEVLANGVDTGGVALAPPVVEVKAAVTPKASVSIIEASVANGQQQALISTLESQLAAETKAKNEFHWARIRCATCTATP